jgi:hypothetical protein
MKFTTALYNIVESSSNWLYRDIGEPDAGIRQRTRKNFLIRVFLILIYYPVICPAVFVSGMEEKYRITRYRRAYDRIYWNRNTTRDDYLKVFRKLFDEEAASKMADDHYEAHRQVFNPRSPQ